MNHVTDIFNHALVSAVERIIACMDGLDADGMNWKPTEKDTNSLYVLAVHTMANAEQTVLSVLGGENIPRERDQEFLATAESGEWIANRWADLKPRIEKTLAGLSMEDLDREYEHPRRGPANGWKALVITTTHAHEHAGHAELTLDLLKAQR